ncbi:MAG: enoyl-CoA hydratase [Burkholderiales bacterium]|jgi:enoyl-CoA hydratase|nr:enoyl-CoA hydratase [Burkholderiales bacterium]
MTDPVLRTHHAAGVTTLTLARPAAMNALSRALRAALAQAFRDAQADPATRVVVVTGAGRAFCAGLDLKELSSPGGDGGNLAVINGGADDVVQAMAAFDGPIVGAINGFAITGGFEIALACDVLIASTAAQFVDTHARLGLMPGWGLSQKLPRIIGVARAKEVSFSGRPLGAAQALAWGLVNHVVEPETLLPTCEALARDMLAADVHTLRAMKRLIDAGAATTLADGMRLEHAAFEAHAARVTPESIAARRGTAA